MTENRHIEIKDKKRCSGCTACMSVCPKKCISMQEDEEGFLYPEVDVEKCIQCAKCVKICPYSNSDFTNKPKEDELALCYAAYNKDEEIRYKSSSGGMFRAFADKIIADGGVVFGAAFDESFLVEHRCVERQEDLTALMGSKYLQSRMGDCFAHVKCYLEENRKVLFTGCGCQIAGLKRFLRGKDENLICIDFICHGVHSPKIWYDYLHNLFPDEKVVFVNFRDKVTGQDNSSVSIKFSKSFFSEKKKNFLYFRSWQYGLFTRPSCEICPFKQDNRVSDITVADCWGGKKIAPEMYDDKGLSSVIVHTRKGKALFESVASRLVFKSTFIDDIKEFNSGYIRSCSFNHRKRTAFWRDYLAQKKPIDQLLEKYLEEFWLHRFVQFVKKNTKRCLMLLRKS